MKLLAMTMVRSVYRSTSPQGTLPGKDPCRVRDQNEVKFNNRPYLIELHVYE